jgi:transposase
MMIKGAMNGEEFVAYIEQCLAPTLRRRDIVVADNVSFHKVAGVENAIEARGAELRLLPEYSPDLNPIELAFHPLKALLRKAATHSQRVGAMRSLLHSRTQTFRRRRLFQALWL